MKIDYAITLLVATLLLCVSAAPALADGEHEGSLPPTEHPLADRFRRAATSLLGTAADLRLGAVSRSYYPLTGRTLYHAKVTERVGQQTVAITLDEHGQTVDGEAAFQAEQQARRALYGKLEPSLYAALQNASEEAGFSICIWLRMTNPTLPAYSHWYLQRAGQSALPEPLSRAHEPKVAAYEHLLPTNGVSLAEVERSLREERERVRESVAATQAPLLSYLAGKGHVPDSISAHVPMIWITLPKAEIEELQRRPDVLAIGLLRREDNALDVAKLATFADYAWDEGYNGSGVKAAVIEVNGRAATDNPYLWGILQDAQSACADACSHATAVAGMVRSRHVRYRGLGYGTLLRVGGSCGGWINQLQAATERALNWGAVVFNHSYGHTDPAGEPDYSERFFDSLVWYHPGTHCISASNSGRVYADAWVGHPAQAYNVLSVGAYDDRNTTTWSDDIMAPFSSFRDPASANGDREKPELCAPGVSIISTSTQSPWVADMGQGTSYASPMVASAAAMIIQQRPELAAWPEAIKAILMASALNNIEYDWKMEGRDGAGGIDAQEAVTKCAKRRAWGAFWVWPNSFDANGDLYIPLDLPIADRARAVIVWAVDPNYADYPSRPQADLDLYWLDMEGNEITASESGDNNFEVVGVYDVSPAGRRTLRVHAYRRPPAPMRFGWAVHWWDE
ncbi:MAG: S8 family serine peptidase [Chloroflexi bacterium]|nr:S8 family serine peptidase [Chloroflexota bacterium]